MCSEVHKAELQYKDTKRESINENLLYSKLSSYKQTLCIKIAQI